MATSRCTSCYRTLTRADVVVGYCQCGNDIPHPKTGGMPRQAKWILPIAVCLMLILSIVLWQSQVTSKCLSSCDSDASSCDIRARTVFQQIVCRQDAVACRERCER